MPKDWSALLWEHTRPWEAPTSVLQWCLDVSLQAAALPHHPETLLPIATSTLPGFHFWVKHPWHQCAHCTPQSCGWTGPTTEMSQGLQRDSHCEWTFYIFSLKIYLYKVLLRLFSLSTVCSPLPGCKGRWRSSCKHEMTGSTTLIQCCSSSINTKKPTDNYRNFPISENKGVKPQEQWKFVKSLNEKACPQSLHPKLSMPSATPESPALAAEHSTAREGSPA